MEPSATRIGSATKARGMLKHAALSMINVAIVLGRGCNGGTVTADSSIFQATLCIILNLIIMRGA